MVLGYPPMGSSCIYGSVYVKYQTVIAVPWRVFVYQTVWKFFKLFNSDLKFVSVLSNVDRKWVIIKKHALFCYYAIKRQISTKMIGENMFCMKAHQLSIVLPSKSRLVQLRIYTSYTNTCFFPWCYLSFFQNDLLLVICTIQMLWFYSIFILFLNYS